MRRIFDWAARTASAVSNAQVCDGPRMQGYPMTRPR